MSDFEIGGGTLVAKGALDASCEDVFRGKLAEMKASGGPAVTLDLSRADFISSVCIGAIVALWIDLREDGRSLRVLPSPEVKRVLDMTGLSPIFVKASSGRRRRADPSDEGKGSKAKRSSPDAE